MSIAPRPIGRRSRWQRIFTVAAALSAAQFLWVFLMGLIAGGQFLEGEWPDWEPLAPWPVLAIPAWVTIAIGAVAVIGAVGMASERALDRRRAPEVIQGFALTIIALIVIPLGLARVYADPSGIALGEDVRLGWHWIAAALQLVTLAALGIRLARALRAAPNDSTAGA